ncbi:hypothetical protein PYW08_010815 [Mythimna loreyi]|uniref:Uncharacterized protein n=1 Tax=Mythimna loreyi TaxID=667449 RepID=A0ACC2Q954_9NEOP|nr:hypothetical protein PYW08_010815 [Mythimna loreyi]
MNQKTIIKRCKELGCCDACCIRYLGLKTPSAYENAQQFVLKICADPAGKPQTTETDIKPEQVAEPSDNHLGGVETEASEGAAAAPSSELNTSNDLLKADNSSGIDDSSSEPLPKRMKVEGVCVTCLGILQEENWPQCWNMVKEMLEKKRYECPTFACALSAPIATILRERIVSLQLKDACAAYDDASLTPLKEAWKWSFGARLARHVRRALDSGAVAPLLVTLNIEYPDDMQELEVLKALSPGLFNARRAAGRRFGVEFTRRSVEQALAGATLEALRSRAQLHEAPPVRARAQCVSVVCTHAPLYLGGRYVKLSRALPQTPWLVNGVRMMHSSVQEIICQPIAALYQLGVEDAEHRLKFMSAGREDVDVRCLGDGRPFAIEITDPTRQPSEAELSELCEQISASGHVRVRRLTPVSREDLAELKKGEETKCKTYELLCIKLSPSVDDELTTNGSASEHAGGAGVAVTARDIARVNAYRNTPEGDAARVLLQQRTPVRVLHRRPLLTRARRILELSASPVPGHPALLVVRVRTEAGTYVKEWAHGELGRTRPRLGDALGARADILALDVAAVELDWPRRPAPAAYDSL